MADHNLSGIIAQLAGPDPAAREAAARELYRLGRASADPIVERWRALPDFAALLSGTATVGVAVQPGTFARIRSAAGSPHLAAVPPDQDAQEFELHSGNASLDILTTKAPGGNGAIARFLEKFGEGIQQVEYAVKDVDRATELLRARLGLEPIYPQTRPGADGSRVNFFLASSPLGGKILIELVEDPRGKKQE